MANTFTISEIVQYLSSSAWIISFSIILSRSVHVVAIGKVSLFFTGEYYSIAYICISHILYSIVGYLGCFYILAVINNAAMNTGVHVCFN